MTVFFSLVLSFVASEGVQTGKALNVHQGCSRQRICTSTYFCEFARHVIHAKTCSVVWLSFHRIESNGIRQQVNKNMQLQVLHWVLQILFGIPGSNFPLWISYQIAPEYVQRSAPEYFVHQSEISRQSLSARPKGERNRQNRLRFGTLPPKTWPISEKVSWNCHKSLTKITAILLKILPKSNFPALLKVALPKKMQTHMQQSLALSFSFSCTHGLFDLSSQTQANWIKRVARSSHDIIIRVVN